MESTRSQRFPLGITASPQYERTRIFGGRPRFFGAASGSGLGLGGAAGEAAGVELPCAKRGQLCGAARALERDLHDKGVSEALESMH